jgi:hypothetical protein
VIAQCASKTKDALSMVQSSAGTATQEGSRSHLGKPPGVAWRKALRSIGRTLGKD